jgi:hypothetical protein
LAVWVLSSLSLLAQDGKYRIAVEVSGHESIRTEARSYLERELRSLGDVALVEIAPDFIVRVASMELTSEGGSELGFVFGYEFASVYQFNLAPFIDSKLKPDLARILGDIIKAKAEQTQLVGVNVNTTISGACSKIILTFDTHVLAPNRKLVQELVEREQNRVSKKQ